MAQEQMEDCKIIIFLLRTKSITIWMESVGEHHHAVLFQPTCSQVRTSSWFCVPCWPSDHAPSRRGSRLTAMGVLWRSAKTHSLTAATDVTIAANKEKVLRDIGVVDKFRVGNNQPKGF